MALTANLVRTAVSADGSTSTFTDQTIYGGSNPARNTMAVYLTAYKVDENLVESPLVIQTFSPTTATSFTITNGPDGNTKYYFVIIPQWGNAVTYNQYDLVYDTMQEGFYQYINTTPSSGNPVTSTIYWIAVPDPSKPMIITVGTSTNPNNLVYQIVNKIVDFKTAQCFAKLGIQQCQDGCDCGCGSSGDEGCGCGGKVGKTFKKIRTLLTCMRLDEAQQLWIAGEKAARLAEKYCTDCGCLSR